MALAIATPAAAQEDADLHGAVPPPPTGDPADPVLLWTGPAGIAGAGAVGVLLEGVDDPAVLYRQAAPGSPADRFPLLDTVIGANLGARWSPGRRVSLAATLPVFPWVSGSPDPDAGAVSGPATGDLMLAAPIGLVLPGEDGRGVSLGVVPWLDLPTGAEARLLGDAGPSGGLVGALSVIGGGASLTANLGAGARPPASYANQTFGVLQLPIGLAGGLRLTDGLWVRAEARGSIDPLGGIDGVGPDAVSTPGFPLEALVGLTARAGRTWGGVVGGRGLTDGLGSANARVLAGAAITWGPDAAGEPALEPVVTFKVVDPAGVPVQDAEVLVGGEVVGRTDGAGELALPDVRWNKGVEVRGPHHLPVAVQRPAEGDPAPIELPWRPAVVTADVLDAEGRPVTASLRATSLDRPDDAPIEGLPGELALTPGRWRIEVSAPGLAPQVRELVVEQSGRPPESFEAVLLPSGGDAGVALRIADPDGAPIVGARVLIDGVQVGTTAAGGLVQVGGLADGPHAIEVRHEAFTPFVLEAVDVTGAAVAVPVALRRVPGSVKIVVRDAAGQPVPDAVARFLGPSRLAPMALGERGERVQVLTPGEWSVVVTSGRFGLQERSLLVPPDRFELTVVELVLQDEEAGTAELELRVVDPEGQPVEGVSVTLGDRALGATSTGGTLKVEGLTPGARRLALAGDGLRPIEPLDLVLAAGRDEQVVPVRWSPGTVEVVARAADGPVDDAVVRFVGPQPVDTLSVGPSGRVRATIPPGDWTVLVTSADYGLQERALSVAPDSDVLHRLDFFLAPSEDGLANLSLRVVDPDGRSVGGARVEMDGTTVGTTGNAGTMGLSGLSVGSRDLVVRAEPYADAAQRIRLLEGAQEVEVPLAWGTGAVRVRVRDSARAPVPDALVRFLGPRTLPALPVDDAGERLARLEPGFWLVLVTSEHGLGQQDLEVVSGKGLHEVELELADSDPNLTDLVVRVRDPDGAPVDEARVQLDAGLAGITQQGGVALAPGLPPGPATLTVTAPDFLPSAPLSIDLVPGRLERVVVLEFEPVEVKVHTVGPDGRPVDALVQWVGPGDVPEVRAGEDGEVAVGLRPGEWQVIATAGDTAADATVEVQLGRRVQDVELSLLPSRAVLAGSSVEIRETVQFDFGRATLRADSSTVLDEVARVIRSQPDIVRIEVQGHTDDIGAVPVNQALSQSRAEAVVDALVARGVPREKLVAAGYGQSRPLVPNDGDEGRATNRRVQFEIVEEAPEP